MSAGDVKVHVAVANVSIANAAHDVVSQPSFHNLDTVFKEKYNVYG